MSAQRSIRSIGAVNLCMRRATCSCRAEMRRTRAACSIGFIFMLMLMRDTGAQPNRVLRVCADPNNLPFSSRRTPGFENEIAAVLARELGANLAYTWWAQRRGFFRKGPLAGGFARSSATKLAVTPVDEAAHAGLAMAFDIAAGVHRPDAALAAELDRALV